MSEHDLATSPESRTAPFIASIGSEGLHEFVRYFVASALALLVDVGALTILTSVFGVPYLWSGAIAFIVGLIVIYILSTHWVFAHRIVRSPLLEFGIFAGIGVVGLGINELVLWILTGGLGLFYLYSKMASVILVFTWNFAARKLFLFRLNP